MAGAANHRAYNRNYGLPAASPMIFSVMDYQSVLGHHFDHTSTPAGRSTGIKNEEEYMDGSMWPSPMRQPALLQAVGAADSSDIETAAASLSPASIYFSEPSEQGTAYSPSQSREEASGSGTWAEQSSGSPTQIKLSPSQSSLSGFRGQVTYAAGGQMRRAPPSRSAQVDAAPSVGQQYETGFGSQVDQYGLSWPSMLNQSDSNSSLAWQSSVFSQPPYYGASFINTFQQSSPSSGSNARGTVVQSREPRREVHRSTSTQEAIGPPRTPEEESKRNVENRLLVDGKAAGLTYKEIRSRINRRFGGDVAESTLRGRHRAMTKQKKDRVRKPTWMPKDVSRPAHLFLSLADLFQLRLLREVVQQQLDHIDDNPRPIDATSRLNKVSWKKVGEQIVHRGGSYHFGNSTCKKKWLEITQQD